ncbi:DUF2157 domain-containing protein [Methanococcoides orientis]|uniref:DUF2157 domain-containing protein n=1 Tax=Methanococcoides orientis TaxID=2822137 RepID=UPI001E4FD3F9|nr:DUF2157 domain-containing protein [Methanococcoides orientis]UGV39849.1 DUF2157 domain-containing protein [Methanococcoides orientis]
MGEDEHKMWLQQEVEDWSREGIVDDHQAKLILSKYGLSEAPSEIEQMDQRKDTSKLVTVISILGAFLIGIGAILFVASNWQKIPTIVKMVLLLGTTYGTYFIGWELKFNRRTHPAMGEALLFLASLFVGATIFLTAQIFNVNANEHWLVLVWFLAILPFGYAFRSSIIISLNIVTFALWTTFYISQARYLALSSFEIFMLYLLLGINLYGLGQMHLKFEKYAHFRIIHQGFGLFFILISYFYFSLETPYREILTRSTPVNWQVQLFFLLFAVTSVLFLISNISMYRKVKNTKYELIVLALAFSGWIGAWLLTFFIDSLTTSVTEYGYTYTRIDSTIATLLFIFFNLIFFVLSIGSILVGYYKATVAFVNIGMSFFVLGVLHLYFTTLYELLPRSLAFIAGGLILIILGWYMENKRRSIITDIKGGTVL